MPLLFAIVFLMCGSGSGALAASNTSSLAEPAAPGLVPLGLKVCLVGAALGAAVERLRSGPNTRKS